MSHIILTDEQRQRIEANRQRALAIRQGREAAAASNNNSSQKPCAPITQGASSVMKPFSKGNRQNNNSNGVIVNHHLQLSTNKFSSSLPSKIGSPLCVTESNVHKLNTIENCKFNQKYATVKFPGSLSKSVNDPKSTLELSTSSLVSKSTSTDPRSFTSKAPPNTSAVKSSNLQSSTSSIHRKLSSSSYGAYQKSTSAVSSNFYGKSKEAVPLTKGQGTTSSAVAAVVKSLPLGKSVNGTFCLISTDRFIAQVNYHQALIEVFKTVQSRLYDANTKQWSFSLEDHDDLVKKITPMRPAVCISPLPANVLKVLREAKCRQPLESVDLSGLDPRLREALLPFQRDGVRSVIV